MSLSLCTWFKTYAKDKYSVDSNYLSLISNMIATDATI